MCFCCLAKNILKQTINILKPFFFLLLIFLPVSFVSMHIIDSQNNC